MKLVSWNVNGFRAVVKKGFWDWFARADADVVGLQETKAHPDQVDPKHRDHPGYQVYFNAGKVKKGYSGVACFTRPEPLSVRMGLPDENFAGEGRLIMLEFPDFYFFNVYFPNGQRDQARLDYKLGFYDAFLDHAQDMRKTKPVVVCGDFNTAHTEIDLKHPKRNRKTSGFLPVERAWLDKFTDAGYLDTFRMFTSEGDHYTWWPYFAPKARANNSGWRIDYFFVSEELKNKVKNAWIEPEVMGSDHCPVGLELDV